MNLADVGRQLGVQSVVTGSVRKADGKLRVSVQLVDAAAGKELWSDTYDRAAADVFAVQSEIAHAIVTALEVRLSAPTDSALGARATQDLGAYELYLQGRFALGQRTDATIPEAARAFQAAVARDSSFARAWAGLAEAEILLPLYGTATRPADAWRVAEHAARRAIALDSTLVEAHTALAYGTMLYAWDWPAAERAIQRAIAADPRYPSAHHWYADFLAGRGRLDEARAEFTRARALDPLSRIIAVEQAWALANLHRTAEADSVLAGVLRLDPNFAHATLIRAPIRSDQGRYAEALADIRRADELGGFQAYMPAGRIRAFLGLGRRDSAEAEIASLRRRAARGTVPPFAFAAAFAALGAPDSAFAWLDRGIRERDGFLPENFFDRMFTPLVTDPRYPPIARLIRGD
ncbi:MAG: tetratricopeptide repeat protein [Gemmatimonadetes bacterium]|nr:tetratricopeptide repeat protein [Gemmatimonadota bacterium]